MRTRPSRIVAAVAVSAALFAGASTTVAEATPSNEAAALAGLKQQWSRMSASAKAQTCQTYASLGNGMITLTVQAGMSNQSSSQIMTRAEWTRVVTKYFQWACPGGRPR